MLMSALFLKQLTPATELKTYVEDTKLEKRHAMGHPIVASTGNVTSMLEPAMKIISLDAPNVWMDSRPADSGPSFELPLDLPAEIDQRDIEDLQTLAQWYKASSNEFAATDGILADIDQLKTAAE
jgi:hypothetical protein